MITITYVQINLLKFELVIYETVAPICLVINENVRFSMYSFDDTSRHALRYKSTYFGTV